MEAKRWYYVYRVPLFDLCFPDERPVDDSSFWIDLHIQQPCDHPYFNGFPGLNKLKELEYLNLALRLVGKMPSTMLRCATELELSSFLPPHSDRNLVFSGGATTGTTHSDIGLWPIPGSMGDYPGLTSFTHESFAKALNNISKIEGIEGCESLKKLGSKNVPTARW